MINKKLIAFDRGAMRFVGANVAFQWLGMLCNIIFVRAIAQLVGAVFAGGLTHEMLRQDFVLCLFTIPLRYVFTLLASSMSDCASKDVKRTLRSKIYEKLTRLGAGYSETVATSEAVMLASEGVEQIDTYFASICLSCSTACWPRSPSSCCWWASMRGRPSSCCAVCR